MFANMALTTECKKGGCEGQVTFGDSPATAVLSIEECATCHARWQLIRWEATIDMVVPAPDASRDDEMLREDARRLLATVFGEEWEMDLSGAGIVSSTDDILRDRAGVVDLAEKNGVDRETAAAAGTSWFLLWCIGPAH
jgi:hypothetical protein